MLKSDWRSARAHRLKNEEVNGTTKKESSRSERLAMGR
jgi:hypothetical protein